MKNTNELKTHVEVGGAILTEKAINRLKEFQAHDNETLKDVSRVLADAVCLIARHHDDISKEEREEVDYLMFELTFVRENINELARP